MRKTLAGIVAATTLLVAGGVAYASIPDPFGVIHACYGTTGYVRVIDTAQLQTCASTEKGLNWDQKGPPGPAGPGGPAGPMGPGGPVGPSSAQSALNTGVHDLGNFGDADIVVLTLRPGSYVVNGKATVHNGDGNDQNADCKLWLTGSVLDQSSARIASNGNADAQSIAVQTVLTVVANPAGGGGSLRLSCATWKGEAVHGVLTAIQVGAVSLLLEP